MKFKLWLEFEHWEPKPDDNLTDDYFNAEIQLENGIIYALNIWTFNFLERAKQEVQQDGENLGGSYLIAPDLIVERLDRKLMEKVVTNIIKQGQLKDEWRVE